jgi:hypothetical protein
MTRIYYALVYIVSFNLCNSAFGQGNINTERADALSSIRDFRDAIIHCRDKAAISSYRLDSLDNNLALVLRVTKTCDSIPQLMGISRYFQFAKKLVDSSEKGCHLASEGVFRDLHLKTSSSKDKNSMPFAADEWFFAGIDVRVNIRISGNIEDGKNFKMYWKTYLGEDVKQIISNEQFEGSSVRFTTQLNIRLNLPGYIFLWIKDLRSQRLYRLDDSYLVLDRNNTEIDANFIPL